MIARLSGRLAHKSPESLILDVHGVGYQVMVSLNTFYALPAQGDEATLEIQTQMRENALELFGFLDRGEKALFVALLGVSGVGPRVAMNILSGMPTADLLDALARGDVARLVSLPGVGRKTAERLVVELQDRVGKLGGRAAEGVPRGQIESDAVSALVNLGYRQADAEKAVRQSLPAAAGDVATLIRESLKRLSK